MDDNFDSPSHIERRGHATSGRIRVGSTSAQRVVTLAGCIAQAGAALDRVAALATRFDRLADRLAGTSDSSSEAYPIPPTTSQVEALEALLRGIEREQSRLEVIARRIDGALGASETEAAASSDWVTMAQPHPARAGVRGVPFEG
jgi:hypothetical protein